MKISIILNRTVFGGHFRRITLMWLKQWLNRIYRNIKIYMNEYLMRFAQWYCRFVLPPTWIIKYTTTRTWCWNVPVRIQIINICINSYWCKAMRSGPLGLNSIPTIDSVCSHYAWLVNVNHESSRCASSVSANTRGEWEKRLIDLISP